MEQIQQAIETFINAADNSDVSLLESILHKDYQNIQDGFFDQQGIFIITKEEYINLIRSKTFGGKPRKISYDSIIQKDNLAIAKVILESPVLRFNSTIVCVKDHELWKVITNIPVIEKK